jgi:hypothetical protein
LDEGVAETHNGSDSDEEGGGHPPLAIPHITADPRKFSEYVLDPENAEGKDGIFIDLFGYRTRSDEDAKALVALYVDQARKSLAGGDYEVGRSDVHGRRYVVPIELQGRRLRSIWILRADGVLALVTPFSGFLVRGRKST